MLLGKCRADPRHDDQRRRIADLAQTADQNWAACRRRAPFAAALRAAQIALAGPQEEAPSSAHTVLDVLVEIGEGIEVMMALSSLGAVQACVLPWKS
jgi:hypothetical protein